MMEDFRFHLHAPLFYGNESVRKNAELIETFGKTALIVTTRFPDGEVNQALADVLSVCEEKQIHTVVYEDTEENPSVACCVRITQRALDLKPDFIVGVGGGSAMDAAKAVSVLYVNNAGTEEEGMEILFLKAAPNPFRMPYPCLPVICIPTTAGSGSEITGSFVITRGDTGNKETPPITVFSSCSLIDPKYIRTAPQILIDTGAMDALSHGIETYLNVTSSFLSRQIAETGFHLFSSFKECLLRETYTEEDYDHITLHSVIMGMSFYQSGTLISHGLGYYLSQHKHVNHGLACSITQGEYLKCIRDQSLVAPVMEMAGFASVDEFAEYVRVITNRDVDIRVTRSECREWAEHFMKYQAHRLLRHPGTLCADDLEGIFLRSLHRYLTD